MGEELRAVGFSTLSLVHKAKRKSSLGATVYACLCWWW